jgi:hypothetical protein
MKNELSTVLAAMLQKLPGVVVGKKFNSANFTVRKKVFAFTKDGRIYRRAGHGRSDAPG